MTHLAGERGGVRCLKERVGGVGVLAILQNLQRGSSGRGDNYFEKRKEGLGEPDVVGRTERREGQEQILEFGGEKKMGGVRRVLGKAKK